MDFLEDAGKFVQSIKYGCELAGLRTGGVRKPLQPLDEENKAHLQNIIAQVKNELISEM